MKVCLSIGCANLSIRPLAPREAFLHREAKTICCVVLLALRQLPAIVMTALH